MEPASLELFKISVDVELRDTVRGGLGSAGIMVRLGNLKVHFHPEQFCNL